MRGLDEGLCDRQGRDWKPDALMGREEKRHGTSGCVACGSDRQRGGRVLESTHWESLQRRMNGRRTGLGYVDVPFAAGMTSRPRNVARRGNGVHRRGSGSRGGAEESRAEGRGELADEEVDVGRLFGPPGAESHYVCR